MDKEEEPVEIYIEKKAITDINTAKGINSSKGIFDDDRTIVVSDEREKNAHHTYRQR